MSPPAGPLFDLSGRVALVTGAGQGLGGGIARALARQGARVAVNDLHPERAQATVDELRSQGLQALAAPGDVTDAATRQAIVSRVREGLGEVDILVNNAGVPPGMSTSLRHCQDRDDAAFERQLDLNQRAVLGLTRLVVDGMCERRFGRIVIVSSESWRVGLSFGLSNYAAAKAAALGFMRQLAHEVGRQGVTANAVSLGTMNNYGYEDRASAVGRTGTPDDVGAAVAYLASAEAAWMTGQVLPLNGGAITA